MIWQKWIIWIVLIILFIIILKSRKIVPTNEAHILQKWNKIIVKWNWFDAWNVYYYFPQWVPIFGVKVTKLPLYVFDIKLKQYKVYDNEKVPFNVDITAFFVIKNPELAAKRIANFDELKEQLTETIAWAVIKIISQYSIKEVIEKTPEIEQKLFEYVIHIAVTWWLVIKNIQFMKIYDVKWLSIVRLLKERFIKS